MFSIRKPYPGRSFRLPESVGTGWKDQEQTPFPAGILRKSTEMEAVFQTRILQIFPLNSDRFPLERARILPKDTGKSRNIPARNTASMKSPEFHGSEHFLAGLFDLSSFSLQDLRKR
jgi:hypothetical protein